jgi:hypothetical protein
MPPPMPPPLSDRRGFFTDKRSDSEEFAEFSESNHDTRRIAQRMLTTGTII